MEKITRFLRPVIKNSILVIVLGIIIIFVLSDASKRDDQLFSKEKIWYSRYVIVEDLIEQGLKDPQIIDLLTTIPESDWTRDEVQRDLLLIRSNQ